VIATQNKCKREKKESLPKWMRRKPNLASIGRIRKNGNVLSMFFYEIKKNKFLYFLALPGIIYFLIFCYWPMAGMLVAFKDYKANLGIWGSPWVGLDNFKYLFASDKALSVTFNTIFLNSFFILGQQIIAIITALFMNEILSKKFKRISQTLIFLPYFISWMVISALAYNLFSSESGLLNSILESFGMNPVAWNERADLWPSFLILFNIWKNAGFLSIIYLAAMTGIEPEYYESTALDGATKLQQIRYITLPLISTTITIMFLLAVGRIFFADFGAIYGLIGENANLFSTTDVIDTFVYRMLRTMGDIGMSSAAGMYQSVVGFVLVLISNGLVKKYKSDGALF
jgi:putative aldouronate transport system permease protein